LRRSGAGCAQARRCDARRQEDQGPAHGAGEGWAAGAGEHGGFGNDDVPEASAAREPLSQTPRAIP
jgi:hypothetical protein